ncbi:MAG TPA: 30S ribosomal protein S16 [Actinomycetota bacterium]|nr:30S ribosomal protein S16 [Actinomycetota bacterium]
MVKIRLMRVGKKKQPSYRVVVADSRSPRDGRIIEAIGNYQPRLEPSGITIQNDRAVYWLQQGAQPSEQVKKLLLLSGAWSEFSGEPAPAALSQSAQPGTKAAATPAASIKATPAASVAAEDEADEGASPEAPPEAPAEPEASEEQS